MKKETNTLILFLFLCFTALSSPLSAITADLREPTFTQGVLKTEKGGVITAPNLRIQARKIIYENRTVDGVTIARIEAEGDIIFEYCDYIFVGRKLIYDLEKNEGVLFYGRTGVDPWYLGGEEIHLRSDGSYVIHNGYATTSENIESEWKIETEKAKLTQLRYLSAKNVKFRFVSLPLFWMPSFHLDLDTIFNSPFRYTFRWGGTQGARIGLSYEIFSWKGFRTNLRLDYRLKRGLGGGLEMEYYSPDHNEFFRSVNYIAEDTTVYNRKKRTRYRYQGIYHHDLKDGKTTIDASYDKLSDQDMATDYSDKGLKLDTAKRTQFEIRRQECSWILDLLTRVRLNKFQTVLQELPTFSGSFKPFELGNTGIISTNRFKLSYLELEYTDQGPNEHDYNSPRYELLHSLYRPFKFPSFTITPETGIVSIYYGNNSNKFDRWMTIGVFEVNANTDLYRFYGNCKHVITPSLQYAYYTMPTTSPNDHFIFDITDGWYRLNTLRFGINNDFFTKSNQGCIYRKLSIDLYSYAFFHSRSFSQTIPKAYLECIYNFTPRQRHTVLTAWDLDHNELDHFNYQIEYTISTNAALKAEYRHRSPFDWRKADKFNFILESFQKAEALRRSTLSDRRDTVLLSLFYRFHPNWALALESRNGWNRNDDPSYNEYQLDFLGTFRSTWRMKFSYRHREDDDRFSVNFSIGLNRPDPTCREGFIPRLEF